MHLLDACTAKEEFLQCQTGFTLLKKSLAKKKDLVAQVEVLRLMTEAIKQATDVINAEIRNYSNRRPSIGR